MKKLLLSNSIFILLVFSFSCVIGSDLNTWYQGVVVLEGNDVIKGSLKINERCNVLQVKSNNKIKSFPAWQIRKVSYHDEKLEAVRNFIVIPSKVKTMELYQFYEVIISGEIMLLSRDKTYKNFTPLDRSIFNKQFPETVNDFANNKTFFFFDGKNLVPFDEFRKVVFPAFRRQFNEEISSYVKEEKLNLNYPKDQIKIMKYFNTLYAESNEFARAN